MSSISSTEYKYFLSMSANVAFFDRCNAASSKKAKLSETDARYEKEKRKREPQRTWKDKQPWLQFTPDGTMICSYCGDAKFFF